MNNLSAFTKSLIFHGIVIAIVSGVFYFKDDEINVTETPIEIAFVAEDKPVKEEKKPKPVKETPPPIEEKPQPAPKALEQPMPKPKAEKAPETQEKKVEKVAPKPPKKQASKPKPKKKEKPKPKAEDKKETEADFMSVLKNLQDSDPVDTSKDGPKLTQSPVVDRLTTGEFDAFRRQLSNCWSILPGAAKAETLAVSLTINVNRDRTVRDVQISDRARYQSDTFFRAAADNAMRAIQHPDCTPLDLPPQKYNLWKSITLNFDPGSMF